MEDTLGAYAKSKGLYHSVVLILVLMEDTLGGSGSQARTAVIDVLILVLMEDTLGVNTLLLLILKVICLNPCFNGRYSRRKLRTTRTSAYS